MSNYVLLTNFWNEVDRIPRIVSIIAEQIKKPLKWLLIDDGSTDGSGELFVKLIEEIGIEPVITKMPKKTKGNLDTLGRAFTHTFKKNEQMLSLLKPDYLSIVDVDVKLPKNYFEHMCNVMDSDRSLGCINAHFKGEHGRSDWPRGCAKVIRWSVIDSFDKFWDLAPDTFVNIKALRLGLRLKVLDDIHIEAPPSLIKSKKGRFRYGKVNFYERKHPFLVLQMALMLGLRKENGTEYLRGYLQEFFKRKWKCSDRDIRYFYSLEYRVRSKLKRVLGIGHHRWPSRDPT